MRTATLLRGMAAGLLVSLVSAPAHAIPAFARKYQFSCSTCHAPIPRLKPFGEAFAARGFRLEDPSQEPARAVIDTGDPTLRLLRDFPFAARIEGYASWKQDAIAKTDVEWPWVLKFLSGSPITDTISYYFYGILEKGGGFGLEDVWMQFNQVFGLPIDVTAGQFQVCDPMFKRELRLERFDYEIFRTHVGHAAVDLTYDRGVMIGATLPGEIETVGFVVNGNGIDMADDFDNFDRDAFKNVALRLARALDGRGRVGFFTYWGKEKGEGGLKNRTYYFGPDLVLDLSPRWQFSAEYLERRDNDPWFTGAAGPDVKTRGGFAELHFFPRGQDGPWVLSGLYNKVASDDPLARHESVSLTLNHLLARNVRLLAEVGRDVEHKAARLSIGVVTAF